MTDMKIFLGNKNYSSWSLRAWLPLRMTGLAFEEMVIPLDQPDTQETIRRHAPAGRVPVLHHGGLVIWDSLAIGEYLAELAPEAGLLPADPKRRAVARAAIAEMHSGFAPLRQHLPMNIRAHYPERGLTEAVQADIDRIAALWRGLRREAPGHGDGGGPFLFGRVGLADCAFAPVVSRFRTYGVALDEDVQEYADAVWSLPAMREWVEAARDEPFVSAKYEFGGPE